jgi:hypothetical protein
MSIISTTNSTCTIQKIEYKTTEAIIYLKITAFARTCPEKGIMIYFKEPNTEVLNPAFKVSSEEDTYQNKIFWINNSNLTGHTYKNVGMESTIPIHIDLSNGTYKDNHLYKEVIILLVDYSDEKTILWSSQVLQLCSSPLNINIKGDITPIFTKTKDENGGTKYRLSIRYSFSEDSWAFNLQHPDIYLEMRVKARQNNSLIEQLTILTSNSGIWEEAIDSLETTAHITITTKLKINQSTLWEKFLTCVPEEVYQIYVKKADRLYAVSNKSIQHNNITRDTHLYHNIKKPYELTLIVVPWLNSNGTSKKGSKGQPLYTIEACLQNCRGVYIPIKELFSLPISISKVYLGNGDTITIPNNILKDISEDFPNILYSNYTIEYTERILSQMSLANTSIKLEINGITATKQAMLLVEKAQKSYSVGDKTSSGLFIGSSSDNYALIIQKGDLSDAK